jgi:hypothetical protein
LQLIFGKDVACDSHRSTPAKPARSRGK